MAERWPVAVGALVAVLLQVVVAPNVHIFAAAPNFILCYVVAIAVGNARKAGYIMPFVCGLLYDLLGSGPVGAMAFVCVAATFLASLAFQALDNETLFIPLAIILASCFLAELGYGLLMIACGMDVSLLDALLQVCLPCGLYDTVLSMIAYPLVLRFVLRGKQQNEMTIIDTGID